MEIRYGRLMFEINRVKEIKFCPGNLKRGSETAHSTVLTMLGENNGFAARMRSKW